MRYILEAYYRAANGQRVLAKFIVSDPIVSEDGIWCTHQNAWGGTVRCFHKMSSIVDFYKEN